MSLMLMLPENPDISLTIHRRKNRQHWQTVSPHTCLDLSCCFWKLLSLVLSPLSGMNMCRHKASQQNNLSGSSKIYKTNLRLITNEHKRKAFKGSFFFLIIEISLLFMLECKYIYFLFLAQLFLSCLGQRLHLPCSLVQFYHNHSVWKLFKKILVRE